MNSITDFFFKAATAGKHTQSLLLFVLKLLLCHFVSLYLASLLSSASRLHFPFPFSLLLCSLSSPGLASPCLYLCKILKLRNLKHMCNSSSAMCHPYCRKSTAVFFLFIYFTSFSFNIFPSVYNNPFISSTALMALILFHNTTLTILKYIYICFLPRCHCVELLSIFIFLGHLSHHPGYFFSSVFLVQEWVTATDLLISLDRLNTFGDEFFKDAKVMRSYFYAISDFSVGGR